MKPAPHRPSSSPPQNPWESDVDRALDRQFSDIYTMLAAGLLFTDNFDAYITEFTTDATPGVETAIEHGLKRVPTGFLVLEKNKAAHLFKGSTEKTSTQYYVQSDTSSVKVKLMIF